ncbi:threonine/serine dehydratase [Tabrizicola sp. BL-A-41-H6]|uniref:threonine/serine dehydratase n=1 Tax=Tabrizicola sp. BL-A-41-H6 TaxID=3421107 RepID=UPI003D664F1B
MDWRGEIETAASRIAGHVRVTPVLEVDIPGIGPVELKLEHLQHTGSFKARGAFNRLIKGPVPPAGVVAASGGNHGAAVAFAARKLGHQARIFVPEIAGPAKIALIRAQGAELEIVPGAVSGAFAAADDHAERTGAMQVHPFDAPETLAGQGTLMREWEAQGLKADTVFIAVGGGGLVGGAMGWLGRQRKLVAVEPMLAPTLYAALQAGRPMRVAPSGIAANALGAPLIGQLCFDLATATGVTSVLVDDTAILAAQRLLWDSLRQWVEPGGATALAALLSGAYVPAKGEKLAVLLCGANPAPPPYG